MENGGKWESSGLRDKKFITMNHGTLSTLLSGCVYLMFRYFVERQGVRKVIIVVKKWN